MSTTSSNLLFDTPVKAPSLKHRGLVKEADDGTGDATLLHLMVKRRTTRMRRLPASPSSIYIYIYTG